MGQWYLWLGIQLGRGHDGQVEWSRAFGFEVLGVPFSNWRLVVHGHHCWKARTQLLRAKYAMDLIVLTFASHSWSAFVPLQTSPCLLPKWVWSRRECRPSTSV